MLARLSSQVARPAFRSLLRSRITGLTARTLHSAQSNPTVLGSSICQRFASSMGAQTALDPAEVEALNCLEQGTRLLEEGDVEGAKGLYKRSAEINRNASSLYNLGVTHYHLKEFDEAIASWKECIELQPSSPDAHTNLASAYIVSPLPRPDLASHHLQIASSLSPEDPEIAFNLAAVLEATGKLEEALEQYKRSETYGIERAKLHIRNVSHFINVALLWVTFTRKID
ncbi:hypothetical protein D9757_010021 [Collybiopsis confluens]|uniref:TPR-like protein n=1 Tax=Collybiopsis confluens TaxID=2823264 RepID=A0A8H5LTX3_9AGAR|nr:hypothetical protein D9757_010021 [Collybiopsis confluens]